MQTLIDEIKTTKPAHHAEIELGDGCTPERIQVLIAELEKLNFAAIIDNDGTLRVFNCNNAHPLSKVVARVDTNNLKWLVSQLADGGISASMTGQYKQFRRILKRARETAKNQGKKELETLCKHIYRYSDKELDNVCDALLRNRVKA